MTESFTLGGDPAAIRSSAQHWTSFGSSATSASSELRALDSGEFVGDEGETFRNRINSDMQPHLDTTGSAWTSIAGALKKFAGELEDLQQRMNTLRTQAGHQQKAVSNASATLSSATSADAAHTRQQHTATMALKPGEALPPSTYTSNAGSASSALSSAQSDYSATVAAAHQVRADHDTAVKACCGTIDDAKGKRFQTPPGFWDKVKSTASSAWDATKAGVSWAAKHIGPILKIVSMVAGLLALIPFLAPIMGPIALAAGATALALDVLNKLMNGEGSWTQMGLDTLGLIPGIKPLTSLGKMSKLASAARNVEEAGQGVTDAKKALALARNAKPFLAITKRQKLAKAAYQDAKAGVASAKNAKTVALNAEKALNSQYAKLAKTWKRVEFGSSAGVAGLTGANNYRLNGDLKEALAAGGVSALGMKLPFAGKKFAAIQAIVANGGATAHQAVNIFILHPELASNPVQLAKLLTSAGKTGVSGRNAGAYSSTGSHPNGLPRSAFEVPNYWK